MSSINGLADEIKNSINALAEKIVENARYNKMQKGVIKSIAKVDDWYRYTVSINEETKTLKALHNRILSVGDTVHIMIPNNNKDDMFILDRIGGNSSSFESEGVSEEELNNVLADYYTSNETDTAISNSTSSCIKKTLLWSGSATYGTTVTLSDSLSNYTNLMVEYGTNSYKKYEIISKGGDFSFFVTETGSTGISFYDMALAVVSQTSMKVSKSEYVYKNSSNTYTNTTNYSYLYVYKIWGIDL